MAIVSTGWELTVTLVDTGLNVSNKLYDLTSPDATAAATDAAAIISALNAVTDATISQYKLGEVFVEDAFSAPLGDVEIENQAMLVFRLDGDPRKKAVHYIPAPNNGIFVASTGKNRNVIDTTDANLLTYRAIFQSGGEATISDGETVDVLESGKRIHKRSSRG